MAHHRARSAAVTGAISRAILVVLMVAGLCTGVTVVVLVAEPTTPASATPGSPGVPGEPSLVYLEDFESSSDAAMQALAAYVPQPAVDASPVTLSASPYWTFVGACNGIVVAGSSPETVFPPSASPPYSDACGPDGAPAPRTGTPLAALRSLATLLGDGDSANHALSSFTQYGFEAPAGETIQLETSESIPVTGGRYYGASVDYGIRNCHAIADPTPQFFVLQGGAEVALGDDQNACGTHQAASGIRRTITSPGAIRVPAGITTVGLRLRNLQTGATGNDSAIDNLSLSDVTPQLDKAFSPTTVSQGEVTTLTFTITNRSDLASKIDWSFTDALPAGLVVAPTPNVGGTCAEHGGDPLQPTATAGATSISVTGGDLALGESSCTITVDVRATSPGTYTNGPSNITAVGLDLPGPSDLTVLPAIDIAIAKETVDGGGDLASYTPGASITYRVAVTNAPSTDAQPISTATGLALTDTVPTAITGVTWSCTASAGGSCSPTSGTGNTLSSTLVIPPGGDVQFTITGTVAPDTTGLLTNTAQVVPPTTTSVPDAPGGVTELPTVELGDDCPPAPGDGCEASVSTPGSRLSIVKSASPTAYDSLGDVVVYTFTVTNTGEAPLTDVTVDDEFTTGGEGSMTAITCTSVASPTGPCSGGSSTSLEPGQVATFQATYTTAQSDVDLGSIANTATAAGTPPAGPPVSATDHETVTSDAESALRVVKVADVEAVREPGDQITYTIVATNAGGTTLTGVTISDPRLDALDCTPAQGTTLAPAASLTCTGAYSVTPVDIAAGAVDNLATASTTTPGVPPATDRAVVPVAAIDIVKSANVSRVTAADQTVTYTFVVTNTGGADLAEVVVSDPMAGLSPIDCSPLVNGAIDLPAGSGPVTCTATYTVTPDDMLGTEMPNVATATGTAPDDEPVSDTDDEVVVVWRPALAIEKTAGTPVDVNDSGLVDAGDTIRFTFVVTNTGNVTIDDVAVQDPMVGAVTCDATSLAPGADTGCVADQPYEVTEDDESAGQVHNVAKATGVDPDDAPVESEEDDTTTTVDTPDPRLVIVKDAQVPAFRVIGDVVTYEFLVTNTGNVPLAGLAVVDDLLDAPAVCAETSLAVGMSTTCTGRITVDATDVAAGRIDNTATAIGTDPDDDPVESDPDTETVPGAVIAPSLALAKAADVDTYDAVGQAVPYTFTVVNNGDVDIVGLAIVDDQVDEAPLCATTTLAVGATTTCTAVRTVTQEDIVAGRIVNVAHAIGTDPNGHAVESAEDDDVVTGPELVSSLGLQKESLLTRFAAVGQTVPYRFTVTNTGNTVVHDIVVVDARLDAPATCELTTLLPGASTTCTGEHAVTAGEAARGEVVNTATAAGQPKCSGCRRIESPVSTARTPGPPGQSDPGTPPALLASPGVPTNPDSSVEVLPRTGSALSTLALVGLLLGLGGYALRRRGASSH